ncbi:VOC family protein [Stappia sp. ES.058]|uniref:VOC family protein n=1 Tax=Stappia sp. ES.058 TaxID=1881061 RepID=UPI00087DCD47|nr:VOC family protein [Stappia sp. ES.058]SDU11251.1 Glyoxalase-like domain-containing protein [Stappia sp. ES.058]
MTARGFDHLVWAVTDLDAAAACVEALGFTVTPRARHPWGTENRLVQLDGFFLELLAMGEGADIPEAKDDAFSFGAFNRDFLKTREGGSMLVLESRDPDADRAAFEHAGLPVFAPFSFERSQALSDGGTRKVGFDLTFTRDPEDADNGFFTCFHRFPENFWSSTYQTHRNGVRALGSVVVVCDEPAMHHIFYSAFTGERAMRATSLGITIATPRGDLKLMTPHAYERLFHETVELIDGQPRISAVVFSGGERLRIEAACGDRGVETRSAPEGLVVPSSASFGLSLVFP